MDELLGEFLTETSESLSTLDLELVKLERDPNNPGIIDNIFRLVHTIKGTCGFLGLPRLEAVAHASENVLGKIRDNEIAVSAEAISLVLESLDQIKEILAELEASEAEPAGDDSALIARLDAMANGAGAGAPASPVEVSPEPAPAPGPEPAPEAVPVANAVLEDIADDEDIADAEDPGHDDDLYDPELRRVLKPGEVPLSELERIFRETKAEFEAVDTAAPSRQPAARPTAQHVAADPAGPNAAPKPKSEAAAESSIANQSIRVSVDLLENLMTMVSELVLSRNQLMQIVRGHGDSEFKVPLQRLSHVTTELQEGVMKTRMQPIGNAWAKLPRIIRDLSLELGKQIELEMLGADTELDRQVLELIKDPLTHMVRNSADHGLETPEARAAAGKPAGGKVVLNAYHEGGHIIIEIKDDGRGLDVETIRRKAIERGIVSEAEAESLSDQQIQRFIFNAGFSTAAEVTSVSGRGVGMDVVRTNIEKIGGTVDLRSVAGRGTTFTIKIPLTLAIVSALIVECADERFAIPQLSVVELVRASKDTEHRIEQINDTPVLRLRNRLLPLVYLGDCLGLARAESAVQRNDSEVFVVVAQVSNFSFGIVVDRVFDTEEIVVKPVAPLLREISMFSGNTILGDGSVIMILDPNGIALSSGDVSMSQDGEAVETQSRDVREDRNTAMLVFRAGGSEPKAVPLSLVARLEEIEVDQIERSGAQLLAQYRGKLMPLIQMDPGHRHPESGRQPILVFSDQDRSMGLMVDEIVDIVDDRFEIEMVADRPGFLGTAVIAGKATNIVDVGHFLTMAFADWFKLHGDQPLGEDAKARQVLLIDDSAFFQNMLTPLLEVAGYRVTTVSAADEALELRDRGRDFDVIISDIEMPGMNGFELAAEIRSEGAWREKPLVALSSHTNPQDFERGRQVGFDDYIGKLDKDALLNSLSQTLQIHGGAA